MCYLQQIIWEQWCLEFHLLLADRLRRADHRVIHITFEVLILYLPLKKIWLPYFLQKFLLIDFSRSFYGIFRLMKEFAVSMTFPFLILKFLKSAFWIRDFLIVTKGQQIKFSYQNLILCMKHRIVCLGQN